MREQISIISFTEQGYRLAKRMRDVLSSDGGAWLDDWIKTVQCRTGDFEAEIVLYTKNRQNPGCDSEQIFLSGSLHSWCKEIFPKSAAVIFIGAAGIAVRTVAPFLRSKTEDPAVLAADEYGRHVISLLSGHLGGGNVLTAFLAEKLGADPVITTASDIGGKIAIDVWAQKNNLYITDLEAAKRVASRIVNGEKVPFYCEGRIRGELPPELVCAESADGGDVPAGYAAVLRSKQTGKHDLPVYSVVVSVHDVCSSRDEKRSLHLAPKAVILGIGCKKGKSYQEIRDFVFRLLRKYRISSGSICAMASIDRKAEESGLLCLAKEWDIPFQTFSAEILQGVPGTYSSSRFVYETTGIDNVCERAAMAVLTEEERKNARFLCGKTAENGITAALLEKDWEVFFG